MKSLGVDYTKERIKERIDAKLSDIPVKNSLLSVKKKPTFTDHFPKKMIDTSANRFEENPYLKKGADTQNLKTAASIYNDIDSISDLEKQINLKSARIKYTRQNLVDIERKLKKQGRSLNMRNSINPIIFTRYITRSPRTKTNISGSMKQNYYFMMDLNIC